MTTGRVAAWVATAGFIGMICFQVLLALGFPLGQSVWGGKHKKLPPSYHVAHLLSRAALLACWRTGTGLCGVSMTIQRKEQ